MSRFEVHDRGDALDWFWRKIGCPIIGHRWSRRVAGGYLCTRCRTWREAKP